MSLVGELAQEKRKVRARNPSVFDQWIAAHPDLEPELDEAVAWFAANRGWSTGWGWFLTQIAKRLPEFPAGDQQKFTRWARAHYPDLDL